MRKTWTAAALLLLAACGSPSGEGSENALRAAAAAVEGAGSARMEMTMTMNAGGPEITARMEGSFDLDDQMGTATMSFESPADIAQLEGETTMIVEGTYAYLRGPAALAYGGRDDEWTRLDLSEMPGASLSQINQDPSQYIDFLRGAGDDIEEVGQEDVRGTETTHYETELSMDAILDHLDDENSRHFAEQLEGMGAEIEPIPTEVWIGDDGLPRRVEMTMTVTGMRALPEGEMEMRVAVEMFDYGVEVDVEAPKDFVEGTVPGV